MTTEELTAEEAEAMTAMQEDAPLEVKDEPPAPDEAQGEGSKPDAVAADEPAPEDATEPAPEVAEDKADARPDNFVPHQALHAERAKRKLLDQKNAELTARLEALENPPEPDPEFVDPMLDPDGFRKWAESEKAKTEETAANAVKVFEENQARQARLVEAQALEQEYASKTPDYADAVGFLHGKRVSELQAEGMGEAEITKAIGTEVTELFEAAKKVGMNPAALLYTKALESGFTKASPAPVPTPDTKLSEADRIAALAKAQESTATLATAQGGANDGGLTAEALANMSEEEYDKLDPAEVKRIMGG